MRVLTYLSQKGGAGKSTLATQLAVHAVESDEVVTLIDVDPQGSAFLWKTYRRSNTPVVLKALPERLPKLISEASGLGITVMMVDTPPHTDKVALEVIRVADFIVCPTRPDLFNVGALAETVKLLELADAKGKALAVINDLPTKAADRKVALGTAHAALAKFEIAIADTTIDHSPAMVAAIADGKGITETSRKGKDAKQIRALWAEITQKWPLPPTTAKVSA